MTAIPSLHRTLNFGNSLRNKELDTTKFSRNSSEFGRSAMPTRPNSMDLAVAAAGEKNDDTEAVTQTGMRNVVSQKMYLVWQSRMAR